VSSGSSGWKSEFMASLEHTMNSSLAWAWQLFKNQLGLRSSKTACSAQWFQAWLVLQVSSRLNWDIQ
jgi:hypothetical protein